MLLVNVSRQPIVCSLENDTTLRIAPKGDEGDKVNLDKSLFNDYLKGLVEIGYLKVRDTENPIQPKNKVKNKKDDVKEENSNGDL